MVYDSHQYRDPLDVLLRKEAATCKGCVHIVRVYGIESCSVRHFVPAEKRCKKYLERGLNGRK